MTFFWSFLFVFVRVDFLHEKKIMGDSWQWFSNQKKCNILHTLKDEYHKITSLSVHICVCHSLITVVPEVMVFDMANLSFKIKELKSCNGFVSFIAIIQIIVLCIMFTELTYEKVVDSIQRKCFYLYWKTASWYTKNIFLEVYWRQSCFYEEMHDSDRNPELYIFL